MIPFAEEGASMGPDKHVDARMARIELAVQRVQLFIVAVVGIVAVIWCLNFVDQQWPDPEWVMLLTTRGVALLLGLGLAFAVAKIIGYPLQVLARA
jgi:uncharacterized protein (DUF983 family)